MVIRLVGGFTNPFEKIYHVYRKSKWVQIFPNFRGEHETYIYINIIIYVYIFKLPPPRGQQVVNSQQGLSSRHTVFPRFLSTRTPGSKPPLGQPPGKKKVDNKFPDGIQSYGGFLKWWYPQIIHFNRVFRYKPSILGYYPYFWKHPYYQMMIAVFNDLLSTVFRLHYQSQKVIGSLGIGAPKKGERENTLKNGCGKGSVGGTKKTNNPYQLPNYMQHLVFGKFLKITIHLHQVIFHPPILSNFNVPCSDFSGSFAQNPNLKPTCWTSFHKKFLFHL